MRIIKESYLKQVADAFPQAGTALMAWKRTVREAGWKNLAEIRQTFPTADGVKVKSGRVVVIFDICGNKYRLIAAIHYNLQIVYTMRFFTHAEYSKNYWKTEL